MSSPQLVGTREADTGRVRATATSDFDLHARHVRLRVLGTGVQRDSLSTDKVVASSEAGGDGEGSLSAVRVEDLSSPGRGGAGVAILGDLEKRSGRSGLGIRDLGHVDVHRAVVVSTDGGRSAAAVSGLGVHLDGEGASGCAVC